MSMQWLSRFGAVCGVILALSLGVPGVVEAFTGETTVTSFVAGLGAAFGAPALYAYQLRQADAAGRFGAVAFAVNVIGLGLFTGVGFALNLVLFFLDEATVSAVLDGPTRWAVLGSGMVFIAGSVLFGVSMLRAAVLPRVAAVGYIVSLVMLAALAPLPDSLLSSAAHVAAAASLVWLSAAAWAVPSTREP
ncbi:hypothetical protein [Catellatospora sp. NPDC049133]|uniref:hypothetical protein n=1 Tax=Catellatospora sp. NPDC049133 TaxID=3155499 RepID=UPI003411124E